MKNKKRMTKIAAILVTLILAIGLLAGCGGAAPSGSGNAGGGSKGGTPTVMILSSQSAGLEYDFMEAYANEFLGQLGYNVSIVYGSQFNLADENLEAVKNAMTGNVVALIAEQDGGLSTIMEEYPDLYVVGCQTDMTGVFSPGGESAACLENDHYLGTIANGKATGDEIAQEFFDAVKAKGYKKVATAIFPEFAFPNYAAAEVKFRELCKAEGIEVVDDGPEVLMFSLLDDSYFMEPEHQDLDAVVAMCDGISFVYPTLASAIASKNCAAKTKLMTGGATDDPAILADCGDEGTITFNWYSGLESMVWSIALLDNALQGTQYADYPGAECVSAATYAIGDSATFEAVTTKSAVYTRNMADLALPFEDAQQYFTRFNPDATYADLMELIGSDRLTAAYILTK